MYKIEKNVPIYNKRARRARKYPFSNMEVGDSFVIRGNKTKKGYKEVVAKVRSSLKYYQSNNPDQKFTIRQTPEGVRTWRIA